MAYTDFKSLKKVKNDLGVNIKTSDFLNEKKFQLNDYFKEQLEANLKEIMIMTEAGICENLIAPVIKEVARKNNLTVWSHIQFDLKGSESLKGVPDYLVGIIDDDAISIKNPILCLGEAKKDDFHAGWGQVAAEMYVAQIANKEDAVEVPIYGLVSNGETWKFGILEDNLLQIDSKIYSFSNLQKLFNVLNWIFCECRKNLDEVLEH